MPALTIKEDTLKKAKISAEELLLELAVYLYDSERLSAGQARALCQMDVISFQQELAKRNVFVKYDIEDLQADRETLKKLRER